ncbi:hypothetical protein ACP70R_049677 [Stipagrostis hirtigluma subsp. patula]
MSTRVDGPRVGERAGVRSGERGEEGEEGEGVGAQPVADEKAEEECEQGGRRSGGVEEEVGEGGGERIVVFTTNQVGELDPALIRRGWMDMHIEMSYCGFEAFRTLANDYLDVDEHRLFGAIEEQLQEVDITPADVAECLMTAKRAGSEYLIEELKQKSVEAKALAEDWVLQPGRRRGGIGTQARERSLAAAAARERSLARRKRLRGKPLRRNWARSWSRPQRVAEGERRWNKMISSVRACVASV